MEYIKKIIKIYYYLLTNKCENVWIDKSCNIAFNQVELEGANRLNRYVNFRGHLGYGSYIGERSSLNAVIGRYCSIASDVNCVGGTHPISKFVSTHPAFFSIKKQAGISFVDQNLFLEDIFVDNQGHLVLIGNDVWIGANVILLPGIHIGNGAVIAAGSVVTKDVNPYEVVAGVPARVIKHRFDNYQIMKLEKIKWWNWSVSKITENIKYFSNIELFLEKFYNEKVE